MKTIREILISVWNNGYQECENRVQYKTTDVPEALKEIEKLLLECKQHIPSGVEEFKHTIKRGKSTCVVDRESYNLGQDDYEKNIKELMK